MNKNVHFIVLVTFLFALGGCGGGDESQSVVIDPTPEEPTTPDTPSPEPEQPSVTAKAFSVSVTGISLASIETGSAVEVDISEVSNTAELSVQN